MDKTLIIVLIVVIVIVAIASYSIKKWKDRQEPILGYRPVFFNMRA